VEIASAVKQTKDPQNQALATENTRLKRQLNENKQELEILKKAAAYFSKKLK
jgi:transposase